MLLFRQKLFIGAVAVAGVLMCTSAVGMRQPAPRGAAGETIVVNTLNDIVDFAAPQTVAELPGPDENIVSGSGHRFQ